MTSSLFADRRGGSNMIQTIVLASMVAVAGIASYQVLGSATSDGADCAGQSVTALAPVNCKDGQPLQASIAPPPAAPDADREEPAEDREEEDPEAKALEELKQLALDILGITDAVKCFTEGDILACAMTLVSFSPFKLIGTAVKLAKNAKRIADALDRLLAARKAKKADEAGDNVADAGGTCRGAKCDKPGVCFAPGTLVHTDRGAVPIEELAPGDLVLSRDDRTGEEDYRPIAQTFVTPDQPLLAVSLENSFGTLETFEVTAPHPFYVEDRGWVAAGDLAPGDQIVSSGGGRLRVASNRETSRRTTVYNFEVEDFHTYFVGESAAWVHNQSRADDCGKPKTMRVDGEPDPERVRELGVNHEQGGVRDLAEGQGGARYEQATGRRIERSTEEGADFIDPEVGPISLKGPLANKRTGEPLNVTDQMVDGLARSVVKDVTQNTFTKRVVVDTKGMSQAQRDRLRQTIEAELAKNPNAPTKEIVFLE